MREQWRLAANKGCFGLEVLTARRALLDKQLTMADIELTDDNKLRFVARGVAWRYMLRLTPDGDSDPIFMLSGALHIQA